MSPRTPATPVVTKKSSKNKKPTNSKGKPASQDGSTVSSGGRPSEQTTEFEPSPRPVAIATKRTRSVEKKADAEGQESQPEAAAAIGTAQALAETMLEVRPPSNNSAGPSLSYSFEDEHKDTAQVDKLLLEASSTAMIRPIAARKRRPPSAEHIKASDGKACLMLPKGAAQPTRKAADGGCLTAPAKQQPDITDVVVDRGHDPLEATPVMRSSFAKSSPSRFDDAPLANGGSECPSWTRALKGPHQLKWNPQDEHVPDGKSEAESDTSEEDDLPSLPEGSEVLRQLMEKAQPGVTFMDVALAIVADMQKNHPKRNDELRYIRDCLHAGPDKTQIPCGLITKSHTLKTVRLSYTANPKRAWQTPLVRGALRAYRQGGSAPPTGESPALQAVTNQLRKSCPFMGPPLPQWPVEELDHSVEWKLEKCLKSEFNTWDFDLFQFAKLTEGRPLLFVGWEAMCRGNCFSEFALDPEKARCFFRECEGLYGTMEDIPYHNNYHAADVTQTAHCLLIDIGIGIYFDPMDVMGLIIAAAIHDAGHDGRNNAFHITIQDNLALTYNDRSILENFHASQGFKLLAKKAETNFVADMPLEQFRILRREVISMVLGTDMAYHFSEVADFQQLYEKLGKDPGMWHQEDKSMDHFRGMVLHTADLANPSKSLHIALTWSERLLKEFFSQGDEERRLGLPVSPMCDRDTVNVPGSQIGFIDFIIQPTLQALSLLSPRVEEVCLKGALLSKQTWENRKTGDTRPGVHGKHEAKH